MERIYCSEQNRDEPMLGTADPVDVWVLLEYRPVWKARAVEDNDLPPQARLWVERGVAALAARRLKARPQFIRQPGADDGPVRLLVGVPGALVQFSGPDYGFLDAIDLEHVVQDPAAHPLVRQPRYFVCTNGQRDVCCARFGLPVYDDLRQRVGERVWQTTHLGGHRFAPNVLALPQGIVYGRVTREVLDDFVPAVEADRIPFAHVRGRAWYPPAVQAAEALSGECGLTFVDMDGDETAATVRFAGAGGERSVRVRRADAPVRVLKSCGDAEAKPVVTYRPG